MPGHKGQTVLGLESFDLTEISGADSLFEASGIIAKSEKNAGSLFGCTSYYSVEGSSLCIRAMVYLCVIYAKLQGKRPLIAAGRNAHKSFLNAVALWNADVHWLYPQNRASFLSCKLNPEEVEDYLSTSPLLPTAVYLTSPDYLGNMIDIQRIADICHRFGVLLVVDNAHGAYLKFIAPSMHPIDLGADLCCDSAHKTLPALTGCAYMHISSSAPSIFISNAKIAMGMVASTSPSYLLLQSLDALNPYLEKEYPRVLHTFMNEVQSGKEQLGQKGYSFVGDEPLKWTIDCKKYGYRGYDFEKLLNQQGIVCEFADPDYLVMMLAPQIGKEGLIKVISVLRKIKPMPVIQDKPPQIVRSIPCISPREAALSPSELIPVENCVGRILAEASVGCPPAVPILVSGEIIDHTAVKAFQYYGITHCRVCI
jgi:arginine/lysine/ornithine decarboxylase